MALGDGTNAVGVFLVGSPFQTGTQVTPWVIIQGLVQRSNRLGPTIGAYSKLSPVATTTKASSAYFLFSRQSPSVESLTRE